MVILTIILAYLALAVAFYWLPLLARSRHREVQSLSTRAPSAETLPQFIVIAPVHNDAASVPTFIQALKHQDYPTDRYRLIILADNCSDPTAAVARSLGAEVFERYDLNREGKGYALNTLLTQSLQNATFDAVVLFDIDAFVSSDFLKKVAFHLSQGAQVIQGSHQSRNPKENELAQVDDANFALVRLHQEGRTAMGLPPILIGSHGIVMRRDVLERLGWSIFNQISGDDLELSLRCALAEIPLSYAADLIVRNDLATDVATMRNQRRRYTVSTIRLALAYALPLVSSTLRGRFQLMKCFFSHVIHPSFANLLFQLLLMSGFSLILSLYHPLYWPWAVASGGLVLLYCAYLKHALRQQNILLNRLQAKRFIKYLIWVRLVAGLQSLLWIGSKRWWPTCHQRPAPAESSLSGFVYRPASPPFAVLKQGFKSLRYYAMSSTLQRIGPWVLAGLSLCVWIQLLPPRRPTQALMLLVLGGLLILAFKMIWTNFLFYRPLGVAIRYFPILEILKAWKPIFAPPNLLEVGSGTEGIGPHIPYRFWAYDTTFEQYRSPNMQPLVGSVLKLPFANDSFDVVISIDMLEHLPSETTRLEALSQMHRVAKHALIIGFPCGAAAQNAEKAIATFYQRKNIPIPEWLKEHQAHGLPSETLIADFFNTTPRLCISNGSTYFHRWLIEKEASLLWNGIFFLATLFFRPLIQWTLMKQPQDLRQAYRRIYVLPKNPQLISLLSKFQPFETPPGEKLTHVWN